LIQFLVHRYKFHLLTILAVLVGMVGLYQYGRSEGVSEGRAYELALQSTRATANVARVDTLYKRDTIRLWRTVAQYDSIRVTDTIAVVRAESTVVYIPRPVADATINQCVLTLRTCEQGLRARDTLITSLRSQLRTIESSRPSQFKVWGERVLWGAAGYGLGVAIGRTGR